MPDTFLFDRPTLLSPPEDTDFTWVTDVSDLTDGPNGTDKRQDISINRTHGDGQVTTFDNAGSIGPNSGEVHLDLTIASFFRVRNNGATNLFSVANSGAVIIENNLSITTGNININTGDLIVQNGNIDIGNLTFVSSSDSLDLAATSSFSIRNSVSANIIEVNEDLLNSNVGIAQYYFRGTEFRLAPFGGPAGSGSMSFNIMNVIASNSFNIEGQGGTFPVNMAIGDNGEVRFSTFSGDLVFRIEDMPTSDAGLPSGALWRDTLNDNVIKQVP